MTPEQAAELIDAVVKIRTMFPIAVGVITGVLVYCAWTIASTLRK